MHLRPAVTEGLPFGPRTQDFMATKCPGPLLQSARIGANPRAISRI